MARGELPKYQVIADDLSRRIAEGEFRPGERLPSQASLADAYGVTLMTLRHAVEQLERDGAVRAARGRGTYVSSRSTVRFGLDRLSSFTQEMAQQGVAVTTEVMAVFVPASDQESEAARETVGSWGDVELVTLVRRRTIDERPVVVQRSTMPRPMWDLVADTDLASNSLYRTLAAAGTTVVRATEAIRAILLTGPEAALLDAPERSAALESTRVSYDARDRPFLVDRAAMLGSATEIRTERTADDLRLGYTTPSPRGSDPGGEG
ncbi:MAG: GntR family transcriptional regulator [Actinomycetota bacterium]